MQRATEITADRDYLLLWLNDNKLSKKNLERKISIIALIVKATKASMRHLETTGCPLQNKNKFLVRNRQKVMTQCHEGKKGVESGVRKLMESVTTRFLDINEY